MSSRRLKGTFDSKNVEVDSSDVYDSMVKYKDTSSSFSDFVRRRTSELERSLLISEASMRSLGVKREPPAIMSTDSSDGSSKSIHQLTDELHWANKLYQAEVEEVDYQRTLVAKLVKHFAKMETEINERDAEIVELREKISALLELLKKMRDQRKEKTLAKRTTRDFPGFDSSPGHDPTWMSSFPRSGIVFGVMILVMLAVYFRPQWGYGISSPGTLFPTWQMDTDSAFDPPAELELEFEEMPDWLALLFRFYS